MNYPFSEEKVTCSNRFGFLWLSITLFFTLFLSGQNLYAYSFDDCMMEAWKNADDSTTIRQLKKECQQKVESGVIAAEESRSAAEKRLLQDKENILKPFTLMAHKPNYILVGAHNSHGYDPTLYQQQFNDPTIELDDTEAQFQVSIKFPLLVDMFEKKIDLFAAYTNHSFWQLYNDDVSSPFRETNHEPEAWLQFRPDWEFFGVTNSVNAFGFVHQSNGRGGVLSRSWNRLYANFVFEYGDFALSFKPWYRLSEDDDDDDNPDITDFLGHYELRAAYKWNDHVFQVMSRNNLESGFENGAIEVTWSFPLWDYPYLKGYVQYFTGYGESLIDYNNYVNKIGIGFALTDWL